MPIINFCLLNPIFFALIICLFSTKIISAEYLYMDYREQDYLDKVERADNYSLFGYDLYKKLTVQYEGLYENRYQINARLVPHNTGPVGYLNRAEISITDTITNKTAIIYTYAFGLVISDEIKENLQVLNKDREFEPRFLKEQTITISKSKNNHSNKLNEFEGFDWIGDCFGFYDIDYDGKKEFLLIEHNQAQRHRNLYLFYDLDPISNTSYISYPYNEYGSQNDPKTSSRIELKPKASNAIKDLDSVSLINIEEKTIKKHNSGGAYISYNETYKWHDHGPDDGFLLIRWDGVDTLHYNEKGKSDEVVFFDYKYEYEKIDGYWTLSKTTVTKPN